MTDTLTGPCRFESGVPLPRQYNPQRDMYRIHEMKIGDSRYFPNAKSETVYSLAKDSRARFPGWAFATRKMADGMRMWRVCPGCRQVECECKRRTA